MATSKSFYTRPNYRFLSSDHHHHHHHHHGSITNDSSFELDESDILYNSVSTRSNSPEFPKPMSSSRPSNKKRSDHHHSSDHHRVVGGTPSSLPVNIPDWSKILRDEYRENRRRDSGDDDDDVDGEDCSEGGVRAPPHEFLAKQMARTRITPFSVHEGIGRTLKGRDLSRVRNAIWEKTGFQD